jgi:hypothetical protein
MRPTLACHSKWYCSSLGEERHSRDRHGVEHSARTRLGAPPSTPGSSNRRWLKSAAGGNHKSGEKAPATGGEGSWPIGQERILSPIRHLLRTTRHAGLRNIIRRLRAQHTCNPGAYFGIWAHSGCLNEPRYHPRRRTAGVPPGDFETAIARDRCLTSTSPPSSKSTINPS